MAFTQDNFGPVSTRSTNIPGAWSYKTNTDSLAQVLASKYFDDKRFQLEPGDSIYCKTTTGAALVEWQGEDLPSINLTEGAGGGGGPVPIIDAASVESQAPSATDTPLQVNYGPPQTGSGVDLSGDGIITFTEAGTYRVRAVFALGRTTTPGEALLVLRLLLNDVPIRNPITTVLDDGNFTIPQEFTLVQAFSASDTLKTELIRDSAGVNNGGLITLKPTLPDWGDSPSARLDIARYV